MGRKERVRESLTNDRENKRITGLAWIHSGHSVTVTIPKRLAEKHGLNVPCTVVFEDRDDGILIKKLELA